MAQSTWNFELQDPEFEVQGPEFELQSPEFKFQPSYSCQYGTAQIHEE